jgi:Bacterial membrane protein YfhO
MSATAETKADQPDAIERLRRHPDLVAVSVLLLLNTMVIAHRWHFDVWLARYDVLTAYMPWYTFMGERLRAFDVPGWNPHQFGGTPFAADPQSGWMNLPAMITFPFFSPWVAFKVMVAIQLLIGGFSTYAFARLLRLGAVASLVAAVVFEFGPFLFHNTYCCTARAQLALWIPLSLLGVELALRADRFRVRIAPWFLAGFAMSQMYAGFLGQGALDGLLVVATYVAYRALISPPVAGQNWQERVVRCLETGLTTLGLSIALGAAGLLPRFAVNAETTIAGGNYSEIKGAYRVPPYHPSTLLDQLLGSGWFQRPNAVGGAAVVLSLLAVFFARKRFAVPYFAVMTVVVFVLSAGNTPLHELFYLIPKFKELHEHYAPQVNSVVMIGPAILSGATVETLPAWRGKRRILPIVVAPLIALAVTLVILDSMSYEFREFHWPTLLSAAAVTLLIAIVVTTQPATSSRTFRQRVAQFAPVLILVIAFVQPTGGELIETLVGTPVATDGAPPVNDGQDFDRAWRINSADTDPSGAGEFLQEQLAISEPFRYVGYAGVTYPGTDQSSYMNRRALPGIQDILVNERAMFLGLYEIQGYDSVHLQRYADYIAWMNHKRGDYHTEYLRPTGVGSKQLLNMLNVRYILVDAHLPQDRDDVVALTKGKREVFRTKDVIVYQNPNAYPRAWIVHDVRSVERDQALKVLRDGHIDPHVIAVIEGPQPALETPIEGSDESTWVTHFEPDKVTILTNAAAPGLLVASEIYESSWQAFVDGKKVDILPTDYAFRGVPIPAGEHTVEFRYAPSSLRIGLIITAISTGIMIVVFAIAFVVYVRGRRATAIASRGTASALIPSGRRKGGTHEQLC